MSKLSELHLFFAVIFISLQSLGWVIPFVILSKSDIYNKEVASKIYLKILACELYPSQV